MTQLQTLSKQVEELHPSERFASHPSLWVLRNKGSSQLKGIYIFKIVLPIFEYFKSLVEHRLTFSSIFEELPVRIHTSALASAFLNLATKPRPTTNLESFASRSMSTLPVPHAAIPVDFSHLTLGLPSAMIRNMEQVVEGLDSLRTEENNVAYLSRQIVREKAKADAYVATRKEENLRRVAQGLPPLPEEDISRLFKIPAEPSRLESVLLLGQIDAAARNLEEATSTSLARTYAVQAPI